MDDTFESLLWKQITQLLGSNCVRTTAYHPIASGLIKIFHCHLKAAHLKSQLFLNKWTKALPMVMLGMRMVMLGMCMALKQDTTCSTAELVYGAKLCLPGSFHRR